MNQQFYDAVEANPIIAAIKDEAGLQVCINSDIQVVFILYGDVCNIGEIVKRVKNADKIALVHVDLIVGLSTKEIAVDYIHTHTKADGILSTKINMIKRAKDLSMDTVFRAFAIDSMSLMNIQKQQSMAKADFVEVLPGVMPKVIKRLCKEIRNPLIAGGMITTKEDVMEILDAGAMAISSSNLDVWEL